MAQEIMIDKLSLEEEFYQPLQSSIQDWSNKRARKLTKIEKNCTVFGLGNQNS